MLFRPCPFYGNWRSTARRSGIYGVVTDKELIGGTKSAGAVTISDSWDPDMERQPFSNA